ncbi:MAG: hypothetical protein GXP60_02495, partial [Epsilonproteobacteria bacterium]|nr:hypothetical protein [Campylobacterota bacterium]
NGYSVEETIAMLTSKRLADWPKTTKRLLDAKKKNADDGFRFDAAA